VSYDVSFIEHQPFFQDIPLQGNTSKTEYFWSTIMPIPDSSSPTPLIAPLRTSILNPETSQICLESSSDSIRLILSHQGGEKENTKIQEDD